MRPLIVLLPALMLPAASTAQRVMGRVLDDVTTTAVVAADVRLIDEAGKVRGTAITDSLGVFALVAPAPGKYRLTASSLGYQALRTDAFPVGEGSELRLELKLGTAAVPLEPLRIVSQSSYRVGRLSEYYDRAAWVRKSGMGRVLMRDDIDRMNAYDMRSLLQRSLFMRSCGYAYMLDGFVVSEAEMGAFIIPSDVEGVEIYRSGLDAPPQYAHRMGCGGLVLVWTRMDSPNARPFSWKRVAVAGGIIGIIFLIGSR